MTELVILTIIALVCAVAAVAYYSWAQQLAGDVKWAQSRLAAVTARAEQLDAIASDLRVDNRKLEAVFRSEQKLRLAAEAELRKLPVSIPDWTDTMLKGRQAGAGPLPALFPDHDRLPPFKDAAQKLAGEDGWSQRAANFVLQWFDRILQDDVWNGSVTLEQAKSERAGAGRIFALVERFAGKED